MAGPQVYQQAAWILHQRNYRDTSRIVELFTFEHGRVAAVAKGVKSARSPLRGILQPFSPITVAWTGKSNLKTLTAAESRGQPLGLQGERLFCGFYLNEILLRLLPSEDEYPELFECYSVAMTQLAAGEPIEVCLRLFEKRLLDSLGYGLNLLSEGHSELAICTDKYYRYDAQTGLSLTANAEKGVLGGAILALSCESLNAEQARAVSPLMRVAIQQYLGSKPLNSRILWQSANQLKQPN